jgi:hypothetical protein
LSTIYHSYLCPEPLKEDIQRELDQRNIRPPDEAIPRLRCYPPLAEANLKAFRQAIEEDSSLIEVERLLRAGE